MTLAGIASTHLTAAIARHGMTFTRGDGTTARGLKQDASEKARSVFLQGENNPLATTLCSYVTTAPLAVGETGTIGGDLYEVISVSVACAINDVAVSYENMLLQRPVV